MFRHAAAASETQSANLHVRVGALELGAEVSIAIGSIDEVTVFGKPATRLELVWQAVRNPNLFPLLTGTLTMFPLSQTETHGAAVRARGRRLLREELSQPVAIATPATPGTPLDTEC